VSSVTEKGPSEAAGIKSGDVIMTFDGAPVSAMKRLPRMVAEAEVGRKVELGIWRKGENLKITVTLGELEAAETAGQLTPGGKDKPDAATDDKLPATDVPSIGLKLSLLTDEAREKYGVNKSVTGALISSVTPDSPAAQKGLTEGDVIVEIDQQDVGTPDDVATKAEAAKKAGEPSVLLFIARKNDRNYVVVKFKK
ncbi:MAG: PDZ domain-containing protein, partial [Alphaproteobacteria bacterium]|nr:PDZ domain-containing protein [Alphaproteobacteria bacterium]